MSNINGSQKVSSLTSQNTVFRTNSEKTLQFAFLSDARYDRNCNGRQSRFVTKSPANLSVDVEESALHQFELPL